MSDKAKKQLFITELTDFSKKDLEGVGSVRETADGNVYRWVKNADGSDLVAGQSVGYELTSVDHYKSVNLTQSGAYLAGVAMSAIPTGQYGWIQVSGLNSLVSGATAGTRLVGDGLGGWADGAGASSHALQLTENIIILKTL